MVALMEAQMKADEIVRWLRPRCSRVEVAGSIRRRRPEVKDIEIVVVPRTQPDLFGSETPVPLDVGELGVAVKNGNRYKQVQLPEGYNLDLFLVLPPAQWGVLFAIRTGPTQFSHRIVTTRKHGGLLPSHAWVRDGGVYETARAPLEMPEEEDFFQFLGIDWIEPEKRN